MNQGNGVRTNVESGNTQRQPQPPSGRSTTALWSALVVLTVALVGVAAYGYLTLQKHNLRLSQLPGFGESLTLLRERLDAAEAKLSAWAQDTDRLEARMTKLDRKMRYNRELVRTEAKELTSQLHERVQAELEERDQVFDARFNLLESGHEASRDRLAQLREEIGAVQRDTGHDLASLHQQVARGESNLAALEHQLERRRVDFELAKNRTTELARGISLRVTKTNVSHQRVKGWLWLMPDRRTLWVRELGIQQPLVFYHKHSEAPNELVITRVTKDAVIGYFLLSVRPEETASAGAAAGFSGNEAGAPAVEAR